MTALLLMTVLLLQQEPAAVQIGGTISGRLLESDRTAAPRRFLVARPVSPSKEEETEQRQRYAVTDASGAFRFRDVLPGKYTISLGDYYYPGVASVAQARPVAIDAVGMEIAGLEFVLPPIVGVRVSGRVIVPDGIAVEKAGGLRLSGYSGAYREFTTDIAADGTFEFSNVPRGEHVLSVVSVEEMQPIEFVVADRNIVDMEVKVPPLLTVLGTVVFEGRAPRTLPSVSFAGTRPSYETSAETKPDGTFRIRLTEGDYRLRADQIPSGYYLKSLSAGSVNLLTQPLKLDGANSTVRVAATLAASTGIRLSGRLRGALDELPDVPTRRISLAGTATETFATTTVNPDGTFEFTRLLPGTYAAQVSLTSLVSSSPVVVAVPDKDTSDLEVAIPGLQQVYGRVAVDGNGPPPQFSLLLVRGTGISLKAPSENELPVVDSNLADAVSTSGTAQFIRLEVEPLSDGTFKMMLPEGAYRVATEKPGCCDTRGIPSPYFIRSINYGASRLMTEPMVISATERADLYIGFGVRTSNPWVKVSGRVLGLNPAQGLSRVALTGSSVAPMEAIVNLDGTFEFPIVLTEHTYVASLLPRVDAALDAKVSVKTEDVKDVEILVPPQREITVRASVESAGPVPGFMLRLVPVCKDCGEMRVLVQPERDGTFKVKLPEDERKVAVTENDGLPFGYSIQSLTYGDADLKKTNMKIGGSASREIIIKFVIDPNVPTGSLRGRVTGLSPESRNVQLMLSGVAFLSSFEVPVNADGSFQFSKLPQGTYMATLTGDGDLGTPAPSAILVTGQDLTGIEIAAPRRRERAPRTVAEERPTGVTITELGRTGSLASESAAVANLRTINTALVTYLASSGGNYGSIKNLIDVGLLDETFSSAKSGYHFNIIARESEYIATAVPASSGGRFGYYSTPDAVVRYSLVERLSPPRQGGNAVQ
jgi:hypothetical protein